MSALSPVLPSPGPALDDDGEPFTIGVDPAAGLIRVTRRSSATAVDLGQHFALLESEIAAIRRDGLPLRLIVDLRDAAVEAPAIASDVAERVHGFTRPGDRIALVVRAELLKLQVRRTTVVQHRMFDGLAAAKEWLDTGR